MFYTKKFSIFQPTKTYKLAGIDLNACVWINLFTLLFNCCFFESQQQIFNFGNGKWPTCKATNVNCVVCKSPGFKTSVN